MTVITGAAIPLFTYLAQYQAIRLELETGMRFSNKGNINAFVAQNILKLPGRPGKKKVLGLFKKFILAYCDANGLEHPSIVLRD